MRGVRPTTDFDKLLKTAKITSSGTDIDPSSTGWKTAFAVPQGKRWEFINFHGYRGGSTIKFDKVAFNNGTFRMEVAGFTGTGNYQQELTQPHVLEEGWTVEVEITVGHVSDSFTLLAEYNEEDAYRE
tara:strand:+ start:316 stop:699 length:384 start_codon:yes stop_codon:yes gene_type:complete